MQHFVRTDGQIWNDVLFVCSCCVFSYDPRDAKKISPHPPHQWCHFLTNDGLKAFELWNQNVVNIVIISFFRPSAIALISNTTWLSKILLNYVLYPRYSIYRAFLSRPLLAIRFSISDSSVILNYLKKIPN